jgi:hypothetical protein
MPMTREEALQKQQDELGQIMQDTREAFKGPFAQALAALQGLSQDDIDAITPGVTSPHDYSQLLDVVKDASARNLSSAQLASRITALGQTAVSIAKLVPDLAALL